jgi:hypothetical protein
VNISLSEEQQLLTKRDVATCQLETAIILFFEQRDPISIHTLAEASLEVLRGVAKGRGIDLSSISFRDLCLIKPEHQKTVWQILNNARNFLKHAEKDFDTTLDFKPIVNAFSLFQGCAVLQSLGYGTLKSIIFLIWFTKKYPECFLDVETSLSSLCSYEVNDFTAWHQLLNLTDNKMI